VHELVTINTDLSMHGSTMKLLIIFIILIHTVRTGIYKVFSLDGKYRLSLLAG